MTSPESFKISSNEYADLIIDYTQDQDLLLNYPDASYNIINEQFAVVYLPVSNMTYNAVYKFSYLSIPKCYGLMFSENLDTSTSYYVNTVNDYTGSGVLIGYIDGGIDYRNPVFRYKDNTTKVTAMWDQSIDSIDSYPEDFYYGTEYSREQINIALNSDNPLSIVPSIEIGGQGTAVAGIAAGYYMNQDIYYTGTAPNAELVIVKLKEAKPYLKDFFGLKEEDRCYQENDLMMGIKYLLSVARRLQRPIVICTSLGSWQGSHKGQDYISKYISDIGELPGVAVIIGAGEEGNRNLHYFGAANDPNFSNVVDFNVGADQQNLSMELWGYAPDILAVGIIAPNGDLIYQTSYTIFQQDTAVITHNETTIYIDNRTQEPLAGDQLIFLRFMNIESGAWKLFISGTSLQNAFHIWLPMHQFVSDDTYFLNADTYTTLSEPGNTPNLITVTSYDPLKYEIYYYASRGYTKTNVRKPDVTAPGVNILVPVGENSFASFTGSSIAAGYTAGIIARLFEWSIVNGNLPGINNTFVRYLVTNSAQRNNLIEYPNQDWGFGVLNDNIILAVYRLRY